jgi:hypothetical protein
VLERAIPVPVKAPCFNEYFLAFAGPSAAASTHGLQDAAEDAVGPEDWPDEPQVAWSDCDDDDVLPPSPSSSSVPAGHLAAVETFQVQLVHVSPDAREGHCLVTYDPLKQQRSALTPVSIAWVALRHATFKDGLTWVSWCSNCPCGTSGCSLEGFFAGKDFPHANQAELLDGGMSPMCGMAQRVLDRMGGGDLLLELFKATTAQEGCQVQVQHQHASVMSEQVRTSTNVSGCKV